MIKLCINPAFSSLENFINSIPEDFNKHGEVLYKGRNTLKVYHVNGIDLVVKSFKIPILINQWVYSFIRPSKAERSYRHAIELLLKDIKTPEPIAYIELKASGRLTRSYYVCVFDQETSHIRQPMTEITESDLFYHELAKFISRLHSNNILFKDLSPGNILYKYSNGFPVFSIIDINRMRLNKSLTVEERIKNFERLSKDPAVIDKIACEYAAINQLNPEDTKRRILSACLKFHKS